MDVVVGVSGKTGGATARELLLRGEQVRAGVRDPAVSMEEAIGAIVRRNQPGNG